MANEIAKRDANRVPVLIGTGNDSDADVLRLLIDPTTKRLLVEALSEQDGHSSIGTFRTTVPTPGTAVQLANHSCKICIVQALSNNAEAIEVGGASVVAAEATQRGLRLQPGQAHPFEVSNTNLLYIDAVTANNGVSVTYLN